MDNGFSPFGEQNSRPYLLISSGYECVGVVNGLFGGNSEESARSIPNIIRVTQSLSIEISLN